MEISAEETYKILDEVRSNPALGDAFRVRVDYRPTPAATPSRFGVFQNVAFDLLTQPEPWLEQLCGGARGLFDLLISHESNPSKTLGGVLRIPFNQGKSIECKFDWAALEREIYAGPREVVFPTSPKVFEPPATNVVTPKTRAPSAEGSLAQALESLAPILSKASAPDASFARVLELQQEDRRRDEERRAEERRRDEERRAEERARQEKREEREEARRREDAKEAREREDRREQREREYQLQISQMQQKSQESMITLLTREPPKNPLMDALAQKALSGDDASATRMGNVLQQMGTLTQQVMGMSLQMIHTQAELNANNAPQSPIWDIAGKMIDGYFGQMAATNEELNEELPEKDQKQLPAKAEGAEPDGGEEEEQGAPPQGDTSGDEPSMEKPLDRFDRAVRQEAPLKELADALCVALVTPDFGQIFAAVGGDLRKLVSDRYGKWVESTDVEPKLRKATATRRLRYLGTTLVKAWKVAEARGILRKPAPKKAPHSSPQPQAKKPAAKLAPVPEPKPEAPPAGEPEKAPA